MLSNPFRRAFQLRPRFESSSLIFRHRNPSLIPTARPYFIYTTPPTTWSARLWYRKDGSPRSKIRGLVIASILGAGLYATYSTLLVVEALDYEHYLLSTLVYIQRVDYDFHSIPISQFAPTLDYFQDLVGYFIQGDVPPEMLVAFFQDLAFLAQSSETQEKIHNIVREAAQAVHNLLVDRKGEHPVETAALAIDMLDHAMLALIAIVDEAGGDETEKMIRVKRLKDQMAGKESSKSYEILG
ncbi:hypothetical protein MIND_01365200 [Mycena indigotica]|uniref:Uncharacterized protein n=1 Tax=Mycena indigotica TaxID=2126181 RepID=A0A8H6RZN8_9AGAR|nr:uncharacterized protein MIND_01365200 [Mycena indigotica]KAF7289903.1 hypothetical protein MIND_01365200 [Mycena indigotica]